MSSCTSSLISRINKSQLTLNNAFLYIGFIGIRFGQVTFLIGVYFVFSRFFTNFGDAWIRWPLRQNKRFSHWFTIQKWLGPPSTRPFTAWYAQYTDEHTEKCITEIISCIIYQSHFSFSQRKNKQWIHYILTNQVQIV